MPKERKKVLCMDAQRHAEYYGMQQTFDELYAKSKAGEVFNGLMELVLSPDNIMLAYRNIKTNTGSYGIICFGMGLTLREGSREYFFRQLDHLFPGMKEKYLQTYGMQYQIVSNKNDELMQLFHHTCEKNGIVHDNRKIFEYLSTFETKCDNVQLSLFDKDFAGKSPNGI